MVWEREGKPSSLIEALFGSETFKELFGVVIASRVKDSGTEWKFSRENIVYPTGF